MFLIMSWGENDLFNNCPGGIIAISHRCKKVLGTRLDIKNTVVCHKARGGCSTAYPPSIQPVIGISTTIGVLESRKRITHSSTPESKVGRVENQFELHLRI